MSRLCYRDCTTVGCRRWSKNAGNVPVGEDKMHAHHAYGQQPINSIRLGATAPPRQLDVAGVRTLAQAMSHRWVTESVAFGTGTAIAGLTEEQIRALPVSELPIVQACYIAAMEAGTKIGNAVGDLMAAFGLSDAEIRYLVGSTGFDTNASTVSTRLFDIANGKVPAHHAVPYHQLGMAAELTDRAHRV